MWFGWYSKHAVGIRLQIMMFDILMDRTFLEYNLAFYYYKGRR